MRLLTHNQLICIRKQCSKHFPLSIEATHVEAEDTDANLEFILHIVRTSIIKTSPAYFCTSPTWQLPTIEYAALVAAAKAIGVELPEQIPSIDQISVDQHKDLLLQLHSALLDTHIVEGKLVCSKCSREYPINSGIPNMRLREDEV